VAGRAVAGRAVFGEDFFARRRVGSAAGRRFFAARFRFFAAGRGFFVTARFFGFFFRFFSRFLFLAGVLGAFGRFFSARLGAQLAVQREDPEVFTVRGRRERVAAGVDGDLLFAIVFER